MQRFDTSLPDVAAVQIARDESRFAVGIKLPSVSFATFTDTMIRTIDSRPCDLLAPDDEDWGEDDSLANIPRTTRPGWLTLLQMDGAE